MLVLSPALSLALALVTAHQALLASAAAPAAQKSLCDDDGDWKKVWADEFETLNRKVWTVPVGVGSSLGRDANVTEEDTYIEDGMLVLRSRELPGSGGKNWTTGAAISNTRGAKYAPSSPAYEGASWQYGRFCIRAKLPGAGPGKSQGLWPAHWMMPANYCAPCNIYHPTTPSFLKYDDYTVLSSLMNNYNIKMIMA